MSATATVLIAEDDPVFRRVLSFTLVRAGFQVETAGDGESAFDRICQGGIDLLITDHQMPRCSGLQLLEKLAAMKDQERPPAILCTAKGLELDSAGLQREFGLVAVVHKPFSPRRLTDLIEKRLSQQTPSPTASATPVDGGSQLSGLGIHDA